MLQRLSKEKEVVGIYISSHPLDDFKHETRMVSNMTLSDLKDNEDKHVGKDISLAGMMTNIQHRIAKNGNEADLKGVELIYQKLKNRLADKGLKAIAVNAGDDFNVDFHEAITQIPAPSQDLKGKIVDVIETGYQLADKVIRFTKVVTGN